MTRGDMETGQDFDDGADIDCLRRRREVLATFVALILILGTMTGAAFYFLRPAPADLHQIVAVAQKAVEMSVGPGLRCAFPFFEELNMVSTREDEYTVSGWVQVISSQGKSDTATFECTVVVGRNGGWIPGKVKLVY